MLGIYANTFMTATRSPEVVNDPRLRPDPRKRVRWDAPRVDPARTKNT